MPRHLSANDQLSSYNCAFLSVIIVCVQFAPPPHPPTDLVLEAELVVLAAQHRLIVGCIPTTQANTYICWV